MRRVQLAWREKPPFGSQKPPIAKAGAITRIRQGEDDELMFGDNAEAMRLLASGGERFVLAYLDPPFFTGRVHEAIERGGRARGHARARREAFDDRWDDRAAYLEALGTRLSLVRELLAPEGCVVVHVDPRTSHYVKVLCDEIFGEECFASEIVWRYRRWPSKTPNFQRMHDVLLRYRRDARAAPRFNQLYEPLAASTVATWGTNKQRAVFGKDGRRERSSTTAAPTAGTPMGDVWDIGVIAPVARERTGYPSQKPEALLERLIRALTAPGDRELDPYAGSGTTLAVAARLGRRFVGIDRSDVALDTIRARLEECDTVRRDTSPRRLMDPCDDVRRGPSPRRLTAPCDDVRRGSSPRKVGLRTG
jgi:site-specific DNA-methyltransferase (adenine-specific)